MLRVLLGAGWNTLNSPAPRIQAQSVSPQRQVAAVEAAAGQAAIEMIRDIIAEPEIGEIYDGKVVKIMDFGAFVNFIGKRDGLVHISEVAAGRIGAVSDVLNEGDIVKVKVLGIDDRGKIKLSMKVVNQETGEDISKQAEAG